MYPVNMSYHKWSGQYNPFGIDQNKTEQMNFISVTLKIQK